MRPSKTVGSALRVDCGLIGRSRRTVLVKSDEQLIDGKPEAYLRQIVVWDLYWTVNGYELHVVDWLRFEECTTTIIDGKWIVMCTRNGRRVRVLAEHRIATEGYVDVELLDRRSLSVYERRGLIEQ